MEEQNIPKSFWGDAARAGGVAGVALVALMLIISSVQAKSASLIVDSISHWTEFFIIFMSILLFGKMRAAKYGAAGFTYGQSIGYTAAMMLFAGFLYGLGMFITFRYVDPAQMQQMIAVNTRAYTAIYGSAPGEDILDRMRAMYGSPVFYAFAGIAGMLVYGLFVSLFVSVFVRTPQRRA